MRRCTGSAGSARAVLLTSCQIFASWSHHIRLISVLSSSLFSLLIAEVLGITNSFHSCLWLTLLLTYDVKWCANDALQYFKWEYSNFRKKFHILSVFRFGVYFESRLLNTMKCTWIKVT